ncbi:broad substrate specificity ATP-binding cassette transporter ABCG2-like [Lytechinus pictus]|uniref:broad substrate specificity ATP-binding cassette transporter ABCG2-like n=1 Tax=Lytechinus pictus TaxID=7653 RepID=UPI0030BA0DFB
MTGQDVSKDTPRRMSPVAERVRSISVLGSVVSFHDITYTVDVKKDRKMTKKVILDKVSGAFRPGMNAILGPTGSGKTSLLDVLAARKDPRGLSGKVLIDGAPQPDDFRCISGYVVQDDIIMDMLSVRENLEFSAALRLPKTVSKKERQERVEDVIFELGLSRVADSKIGNAIIRGVSGGERKRTNVGMELIIKPSVLFLDEPTTGLDASTANSVLNLLAQLSKRGRTIIFSIHQPRFSIFRLFDQMHLVAAGKTVFHGPANKALSYFSSIGYECESHNNPPDFFLDVINGETSKDEEGTSVAKMSSERGNLAEIFEESNLHASMNDDTTKILGSEKTKKESLNAGIEYPTSFWTQLQLVTQRTYLSTLRNPVIMAVSYVVLIVMSLLVGLLYFDMDLTTSAGVQNRAGATFFICMNMVFSNINSIEVFIHERVMFIHETASGFYRVSVYFFAKCFVDYIVLRLIPSLFYSVITYFMIGLQVDVGKYFFYLLSLLSISFASSSLSVAISSSADIVSIATLLLAMCFVLMMLFGGLFVNIASLPVWLQWIQYLSIFRYGINALLINEMTDLTFCDTVRNITVCTPGYLYLEDQGINYTTWGLWQNIMALILMGMGFMALAYIQLRRMPKLK